MQVDHRIGRTALLLMLAALAGGCAAQDSPAGGAAAAAQGGASGSGGTRADGGLPGGAGGAGGASGSGGMLGYSGSSGSGGSPGVDAGVDQHTSPSADAGADRATSGGAGGTAPVPGCGGATVPPAAGEARGTPGVWENVTPAGVDLKSDFGLQDVLVDPVRPSDLYTFVCKQGVWKSTDYGLTWAHVSTGTLAAELEHGRPWGAAIDSNRCRDPRTPPTLYTFSGYGSRQGFWRSQDGGVNWKQTSLPKQPTVEYQDDAYSVNVDPNDGRHLLVGMHERPGLLESTDGGDSFKVITVPAGSGGSVYAFFVDTGDPATTRATWLAVPQFEDGKRGTWRTTDAGATWSRVSSVEHFHGCAQGFFPGNGVAYLAGGGGIFKSTDSGATWLKIFGGKANVVIATPKFLYTNWGWANAGGHDEEMQLAPRTAEQSWSAMPTPPGMTNGTKGAAVTTDGKHHIIVSGNWNAGLWRYVEP